MNGLGRIADTPIGRTVVASAGPFAVSGSQFVLSYALLRALPAAEFGAYSFLLVAAQFSWGVSSALIGAPLPLAYQAAEPLRTRMIGAMFGVSALGALACLALFVTLGTLLLPTRLATAAFAVYTALAMLRWFGRANAYALGQPLRATASDFVQAAVTVIGSAGLLLVPAQALLVATLALLAGSAVGIAPFGRDFWRRQVSGLRWADLPAFAASWRAHGRWSLAGLATTESTTNAHTYIVTGLRGPAFYAPIAASTLIVRPITVAMNALSEFERARMARAYGAGNRADMMHALRHFRIVLALGWIVSVGATALLFMTDPGRVFPHREMQHDILVGAVLNLLLALIRTARVPDSTLLQATGAFRPLAMASALSAGISILLVLALVLTTGPVWSLLGIVAGECVYATATFVVRHRQPHAAGGTR